MKQANYSKEVMRAMLGVLPYGTMKEVSEKLKISYHIVSNACHGKQYNKAVIDEIEKRYKAVVKELKKEVVL